MVARTKTGERQIMIGSIHTNRAAAEARFTAAQEGQAQSKFDGIPIYAKETVDGSDKLTGLSEGERKMCNTLADELIAIFSIQKDQLDLEKATRAALATQ